MEVNINKEKITLNHFVSKNIDLLTTVSIFAALAIFARDIVFGIIGEMLAILFLSGFVLLWMELCNSFPNKTITYRLSLFEQVIMFSGIAIIFYWFSQIKKIDSKLFIFYITVPIFELVFNIISRYIEKEKLFNRLFEAGEGEKSTMRPIVWFLLIFIVFYIILNLVSWGVDKYESQIDMFFIKILKRP